MGPPILACGLELALVKRSVGVHRYARPLLVNASIDLAELLSIARNSGGIVFSTGIVLRDEDTSFCPQFPQRRCVSVVGFMVHQESDTDG